MASGPEIRGLGKNKLKIFSAVDAEAIRRDHLIFELNVLLEVNHSALLRQAANASRTSKCQN